MSLLQLQRRYVELGRIRLGEKGPRGAPRRLDKFRLTSASKVTLEAAAKVYGGEVKAWTDAPSEGYWQLYTDTDALDVLVPPSLGDSGPYSQSFELWSGGGAQRRCDGTTELISGERCLCDPDDRECEIITRVSLILPNVPGLGVWRLDTGGYNAAAELPGTLDLLSMAAQGQRFIPAVLRLEQRTAKRPGPDGKPQTRRFSVPVLDVKGTTAELMSNEAKMVARIEGPSIGPGTIQPPPSRTIDFGPEPEMPTDPALVTGDGSSEPAAIPPDNPSSGAAGSPHKGAALTVASEPGGSSAPSGSPHADAGSEASTMAAGDRDTPAAALSRGDFQRRVKAAKVSPGDVIQESQALFPDTDPRELTDEQRATLWRWLSQPNGLMSGAQTIFPDATLVHVGPENLGDITRGRP